MSHDYDWSCLTGKVVLPAHLSYTNDRINYNTRRTLRPAALVFCQKAEDVQNAIKCARGQGIPFRVRSGRHNYEQLSLMKDGLIIDISGLTAFTIDPKAETAQVGAGLAQQQVWDELRKTNKYALPLGTMGKVGISGVLQGGGIGMMTRAYGLAIDRVTSIQLVTAAGNVVEASATSNADLYWALKGGGGGNFGIITAFTLKLVPLSQVVVYAMSWPKDKFLSVMRYWQTWAPTLPDDRLTCQLAFSSDGSLHSEGVYLGTKDELSELLQPWRIACPPSSFQLEPMSWYDSTVYFNSLYNQCSHAFKASGAFVYQPLPDTALNAIHQAITCAPEGVGCDFWMQSFGGAMARVSPTDSAFHHRQAQFIIEFEGHWDTSNTKGTADKRATQWTRNLRTALREYTVGAYVNFADLDLGSRSLGNLDYLRMYYGDNVDKLRTVKRTWDPDNVFQFEQSIPPWEDPSPHAPSREG